MLLQVTRRLKKKQRDARFTSWKSDTK